MTKTLRRSVPRSVVSGQGYPAPGLAVATQDESRPGRGRREKVGVMRFELDPGT